MLKPQYTIWQAINVALAAATRAIQEVRALARLPGPAGPPGEKGDRGADGFGFDDIELVNDRHLVFKRKGEPDRSFFLPIAIYRGVYNSEMKYERGDGVTWGGSYFTAQCESIGIKPGTSADWKLTVKRGRDGKDGDRGPGGPIGPSGKDGRDLTQLGTDGKKW